MQDCSQAFRIERMPSGAVENIFGKFVLLDKRQYHAQRLRRKCIFLHTRSIRVPQSFLCTLYTLVGHWLVPFENYLKSLVPGFAILYHLRSAQMIGDGELEQGAESIIKIL